MSDTTSVYQAYQGNTYLFGGNAPYVEEMYEAYLDNPGSVPDNWRDYFDARAVADAGALRRALANASISDRNATITLTPYGLTRAVRVIRSHRLWELYLHEHAGVAPDHVGAQESGQRRVAGADGAAGGDRRRCGDPGAVAVGSQLHVSRADRRVG